MKRTLVLVAVLAVLVYVVGATGSSQQRAQMARQPLERVVQTTLSVNRMIGGGTEFQDWKPAAQIDGPAVLQFRWSTTATGGTAARCVVTDLPIGRAGSKTVKTLPLPGVPASGHMGYFSVNFTDFIPKTPPKKPYVLSYYVYVIVSDASKKDLRPSNAVSVTYGEPGAQTTFDEDMGVPSNQSAVDILNLAREALKTRYGFYNAVGNIQTDGGILAFQRFKNAYGSADASIEVSGPLTSPVIYVGVPRRSPFGYGEFIYQWYRYTVRNRSVVPAADPGSDVPLSNTSVLPNPGAWCDYGTYTLTGEPPHWSPILVKSDTLKIEALHRDFQYTGADRPRSQIEQLGVSMANVDLTERVQEQWQPVRLNGFVDHAWYPSGDLGTDHNEDYHDGDDAPTGHLHEETDITWAGLDWDMTVVPDPSYNYLASTVRPTVRVEMEQFALMRKSYWPQTHDWLQAIGRWVADCGHTSYTEIHPPEVLAATTQHLSGAGPTRTRVTVTGAYLGGTIGFVVHPPPRPSATSTLYYRILREDGSSGYDRKDNVNLEIEQRGTPGKPNHLYVKVVPTASFPVIRFSTGRVGYTRDRRLQCVIECGWEGEGRGTLTVSAGASKEVGYQQSMPVNGAYLFYRSADVPGQPWEAVRLPDDMKTMSMQMPIGPSFWFRPAGSGWNFGSPFLYDPPVPSKVTLKQDEVKSLPFGALADTAELKPQDLRAFAHFGRRLSPSPAQAVEQAAAGVKPGLSRADSRQAVAQTAAGMKAGLAAVGDTRALYSALLSLQESGGTRLGVKGNNLGYGEKIDAYFRLKSLVGEDGTPIKDQASAVLVDNSTNPPSIALRGTPGGGVPGARVRARLLLGNESVGFRVAGQADVVTGYEGLAHFRLEAGTHVENATIAIEVLENPSNPWFLPKIQGSSYLFYPGDVDIPDSMHGSRVPYTLRGFSLRLEDIKAILAGRGGSAADQHFLGEVQERVAVEQNVRKRFGRGSPATLKASFKKLETKKK